MRLPSELYTRIQLYKNVGRAFELTAGVNTYGGPCQFCHGPNEPYMVEGKIWYSIDCDHEGFVCLKCLAERLGRKLQITDFTGAPINYGCFGFDCREYVKEQGSG